jgi:hypothetical protein
MSIIGSAGPRRGRQRGGRHKKDEPAKRTVKHHIVVDDDFWQMLEAERRAEETNNEALWRIFTDRTKQIQELRKKVDALLLPQVAIYVARGMHHLGSEIT